MNNIAVKFILKYRFYILVHFFNNLSYHYYRDDDVRSSLDLLDEVIGEFDDGLTSAAESDILLGQSVTTPVTKRSHRYRYDQRSERQQDRISSRINGSNGLNKNENLKERDTHLVEEPIKANVRNIRPPVTAQKKQRDQSAPPYLNASRTKQNVASSDPRSQVLNHQIDDIFSELTNEIYVDDKRDRKSAQRTNDNNLAKNNRISAKVDSNLSLNGSDPNKNTRNIQAHIASKKRQQGPSDGPPLPPSSIVSPSSHTGSSAGSQSTRHVNDPLPAPPVSNKGGNHKGVVSSLAAKISSTGGKR